MKIIVYFFIAFFAFACNKGTTNQATITSKVNIQLCNSNYITGGQYNPTTKWTWTQNSVSKNVVDDSLGNFIIADTGVIKLLNFYIDSSGTQNNFDTSIYFQASKTYSVFALAGRQTTTTNTSYSASVVAEKDFTAPANGYSKIRLIVAVPALGRNVPMAANTDFAPNLIFYNNNNDSIKYNDNSRYYLDHLSNSTLLDFKTVPSGIYNQAGIPNIYSSRYAFKLESGKKYTIMVTKMIRNQYPNLDDVRCIPHIF